MLTRTTGWWVGVMMAIGWLTAAAPQDAQPDRGEQIMNGSCTTCHDLRTIEVQALDNEAWTKTVNSMVEKGAELKAEDAPILIDYLVKRHGPLPEGAGKQILLNSCTLCHDLQRIKLHRGTREEWEEILEAMLNEGASLSLKDFAALAAFLARNFGTDR